MTSSPGTGTASAERDANADAPMRPDPTARREEHDARHLLAIYVRDHWAGAAAGVSLAARCRRNNAETEYEATLADLEREIGEDRDRLRSITTWLDIEPSRTKAAIGALGELVARVKGNGRILRYSPSSRVVELETLSAGIATKGHLWRTLQVAVQPRGDGSPVDLDELERRAASQLLRVTDLHERATAEAFGAGDRADPAGRSNR